MKKSDLKQREKAWDCFNSGLKAFMQSLTLMQGMSEEDYTIDDLNQMGARLHKLAATIERISERRENE